MAKFNWMNISKEDVIKAIDIFNKESPEYPEPKVTFLIYKGQKLPAKHIRGMAYKVAYGKDIRKSDYGGGMETVRFFERLGFEMHYTGKSEQRDDKSLGKNPLINEKDKAELSSQENMDSDKEKIKRITVEKKAITLNGLNSRSIIRELF